MDKLLLSYSIVCISSLICVLIGNKLIHPKNKLFITLCYLSFIVFFIGRLYEVSRLLLGFKLYNIFELGFIGIIGTFSFLLSSNFGLKQETNIKITKSVLIKSLILSIIVGSIYFVIFNGVVNTQEKITDLIMVIYASSNIYYFMRHILLTNDDKSNLLSSLKLYNIFGILFSILIDLLLLAFAYNLEIILLIVSLFMSVDLILMILSFMKGIKTCKLMN